MNFYDDIKLYGESTAIITDGYEKISYNTLLQDADELNNIINKRCIVFSMCKNCYESVLGYIGFLRGRIVPVMISENINRSLFKNLLNLYKPKYIWLPKEKVEELDEFIEVYNKANYVLLKTNYDMNYTLSEELALLLTTSGSTGSPKLVRQSYKNITSNANAIVEYLNITNIDRAVTTLPMSYTYGLSIINSHLLNGASIILTEKTLMDRVFWELLKSNNATTFGGVPYTYEILKKLRFAKMNLQSLKVITQAGGKLSPEMSKEFATICEKKGIKFYVMYGQTEATARMSYLSPEYSISKVGSIGLAIPKGKFSLRDGEGNDINECETVGELVYQGDNVTMGYAESCVDLNKGDENKGILVTGDMAKMDEDGFYYIVGRKKRFLKLFGSRVNLDEMEHLLKLAGVECVCSGIDDNLKIYLTDESNISKVKNFVTEYTDINPAGFKIYHVEVIPRNEAGKVLYSALK